MSAVPKPPAWADEILTVGVTGTNGKTTTTAWVAAALRTLGDHVARATTVGFFLDEAPLAIDKSYDGFLAGMHTAYDRGGRHAAIELTSEALARGFAKAWPCRVGVFTNLTHDHMDAHGSPEHYLASKAQLFVSLPAGGTAVLNASDENFELLKEILPEGVALKSYAVPSRGSVQGTPDLLATRVSVDWSGTTITCESEDTSLPKTIHVRAIGEVYAENALAALLGAVAAGADPQGAAEAISRAAPPPGRFEVIHENPWVVVDYAHTPDSLARTEAIARGLAKNARLFVVFGAGGKRDRAKRKPMGEAARPADFVFVTTDNPRDEDPKDIARAISEGLVGHAGRRTIIDREKAIATAITEAKPEDVILIAGKGHETEMTVGTEVRHFSDVEVAKALLAQRA